MSGEKALVGEYKLLELVGEGSFGKVWKARKVGDLRTVAIKLIPKRGKKDKDIRGLRQEIDILRKLRHRNIIEMIDAFETGSDFCVVTEFAQGELFEILETDTSLSEEVVQTLAGQLVDALHYLHSNRIIHRDMKPQNILIAADGTVKLCDFGFARAMSQNTVVLTSIKGTPLYMAPELVQEKPYTHAVDLWSLGVILYELFVGKPPFYTSSIYALIKQIVHDPPVYPSSMSGPFKSFLKGLLEKDPNRRLDWPEIMNHPFVAKSIQDRRTEEECRVVSSQRVESTEVPATSTAPHHAHQKAAPSQKRSSPSKSGINVPGASPAMRKPNGGSTNQGHEPMFLDPPQFSPQGSPGDGPMGSAIAASSLSKAAGSASPLSYPQQSPPILTVLVDAERKAKKGEYTDAVNVLLNPSILEAIKGALNPPSSGLALTKWCKLQETQHVLTLLDQILAKLPANASLQEVDPTGQLVSVLVLLAKAAHLCVGANPQFSAGAAGVLRKCNDWVISLETVSLCCELVSSRTSWAVVEEGCCGIRHWALKSQYTVLDKASRFKVMSEKVIDTLCKKRVAGRICRCIEDNARSSQSQSESLDIAALTCLATLLPCSHGSVTDLESRADWSPCLLLCEDVQAAMNTLKISDSSHLLSLWILTTQSIYESNETFKSLLRQVRENSQPVSSSMLICMLSRLMRLEPRISKTVFLSKVTDGLLRNSSKTRMISSALLLSNVCEGISKTCAPKDVAFVEQQFASSIFDAMKGQWIPMITNKKADTVLTAALCDAIGSFMLLFFRYWSIGSRYSHVTALKSCVPVIRDILDTWTVTPGAPAFSSIEGAPCPRGLVDGPMRFVHGFALFDHKGAIDTGLVSCVMNIIGSLGSNSNSYAMEMTPVGLLNALQCIQIGVENSLDALEVLVEDECLVKTLISIMSPNFIAATKKFYAGAGAVERNLLHEYISGKSSGSMSLANNILAAALSILQAPWTHTSIFTSDVDKILDPIKNHLSLESNIIPYLVGILHSVNFDDPCGKILLPSSAAMLARLVLIHGDEAVVIFARSGGLDGAVLETLLNAGNSDSMLASALLVVSQLARTATSKHQIEKFVDSGIMTLIPPLLSESTSSGVRARACNLLGNLCRYSDAVYPSIQELGILPPLIELCQDDDRSTRKFACFAIGNAGFHSDYLYEDLQHAVPILVGLLEDEEDRTRANAAGALGNLVRNSSLLVPKMLSCGAVESLLRIIREAISAVEGKSTAFQIALFSLGNLAAHHECLPKFQELRVADVMLEVESTTKNSTILKYANRVLTKMNTASSGSKSRSKTKVQQTPLRERDSDKSTP